MRTYTYKAYIHVYYTDSYNKLIGNRENIWLLDLRVSCWTNRTGYLLYVLYTHLLIVFGTSLKASPRTWHLPTIHNGKYTRSLTHYMQINIIYMTLQLTSILFTFIYVSIIKYQYFITYTSTKLWVLYMVWITNTVSGAYTILNPHMNIYYCVHKEYC